MRNNYIIKTSFALLLISTCALLADEVADSDAVAMAPSKRVNTQEFSEVHIGKIPAWIIHETDLTKAWGEIDDHITPLMLDHTLPYYSYHIIDGHYYIIVAYVNKEGNIKEQWVDVTAYCMTQIPKLQEMGVYVKKAHELLDSITSREEADAAALEFKEIMVKIAENMNSSDMPPHVFPQLREQYRANIHSLFERMADIIRKGSFGSEKLAKCLKMFFA